jgi:hypothetical protein
VKFSLKVIHVTHCFSEPPPSVASSRMITTAK